MPLTDTAVRNAKPTDKIRRLFDGGGLYLELTPTGSRLWRMKYRYDGKEKRLSFGSYPTIALAEARQRREEAKKLLANGVDPGEHKKAVQAARQDQASNSFEIICREWMATRSDTVEKAQCAKTLSRMENDVFPWIGKKSITAISSPEILSVLKRIDDRGARYTARRTRSEISRAYRYAIATGRAERDPCPDLRDAIPAPKTKNFPSITEPSQVGELLRALEGFRGTFQVRCALLLAPMLFVRPGELRKAEWSGIDLEKGEWRYLITKTQTLHLVPLASQVVSILRDLHPLTGHGRYLFPGRDPKKPMSEAAINAALRRLGYNTKTEITGHGFRAMARTILAEELHQKPEVIEHQLGHSVPDALGTAYNRTKFLNERRVMMQIWADYLDQLRIGARIISIHETAALA